MGALGLIAFLPALVGGLAMGLFATHLAHRQFAQAAQRLAQDPDHRPLDRGCARIHSPKVVNTTISSNIGI